MASNALFKSRAARTLSSVVLTASLLLSVAPATAQEVDTHYAAGVAAFAAGDYPTTITEMNASIAAHPNSKAALYLGNACLKLGQLGAAKAALKRALQLDPNNPKRDAIARLIKGIEHQDAAKVTITSTPPGATVYLGSEDPGAAFGKTPNELALTPGAHTLFVGLEGYETEKRDHEFTSGEKVTLEFALRTKGCDVSLSAEPPGARASIDGGEPLALPVSTRVGVAAHTVVFKADGYESSELPLACDGTKPVTLAAKLVRIVPVGRVKVQAPGGTVVAIDGKVISAEQIAAGLTLSAGRHEVTFTAAGKPPYKKVIEVPAGAEIAVEPPPAPAPPPAPRAGFPARGIYMGLIGGGNLTLVEWNLGADKNGAYPKSSATAGVRLGVQLIPRLAVEVDAHWVGLPNSRDDGLGHGLSTEGNVLFHVLGGRWTPIVEAGAGTYEVLSSKLGADADLRLHAGVGLRGALNDWLSVRADVRDVITDGFDKSTGNNLEMLLGVEAFLWKKE